MKPFLEYIKFTFSGKATKIDKIFTVNLTVCSNRQIDGEDFVNFCGLLRKHELYTKVLMANLSLVTDFSFDSYVYLCLFLFN